MRDYYIEIVRSTIVILEFKIPTNATNATNA